MMTLRPDHSSLRLLALPMLAFLGAEASAQVSIYPLKQDPALNGFGQVGSQASVFLRLSGAAVFGSFVDFSDPGPGAFGTGRWGIDGVLTLRDDHGPTAYGMLIDLGDDGVSRITCILGKYYVDSSVGVFADGSSISNSTFYGLPGGSYQVISPDGMSIFGTEFDEFFSDPKQYRYRPGGVRELVYDSSVSLLSLKGSASSFDGSMVIGELEGVGLVRWTEGGGLETIMPISTGTTPSGGFPMDMSYDGSVIVGKSPSNYPAVWREGLGVQELTDCPFGPGDRYSVQCSTDGLRIDAWRVIANGAGFYTWTSATGWRSLEQVLAERGARDFQSITSPILFGGSTKNLDAVIVSYRDPNDLFLEPFRAVAFIGAAPPGAIGSNFCGPAEINASGYPALLLATGSTSVQANSLTLTARFLPAEACGYVISSAGSDFVQAPGGSAGNLCLGGGQAVGRHDQAGEICVADEDGTIEFPIDVLSLPSPTMAYAAQPGETLNFQVWFRDVDPNGVPTSNFTDAVGITFE